MRSVTGSPVRVAVVAAVVSAFNYLVWLAWDQHVDVRASDGYVTGPYEPWQIVGMIAVLVALAVYIGLGQGVVHASLAVSVSLTICFAVDAATDARGDGLWPIGAGMVAIASFAGVLLVATTSRAMLWPGRPPT